MNREDFGFLTFLIEKVYLIEVVRNFETGQCLSGFSVEPGLGLVR